MPNSFLFRRNKFDIIRGRGCEIRTHAPLPANGFQDRLVMTASITLRVSNWPQGQQIPKYEIEKIARKLRDAHLAKCKKKCEKPNKIKGFGEFAVIRTIVFQDRLVMTTSISLRNRCYATLYHMAMGFARIFEKEIWILLPKAWPMENHTPLWKKSQKHIPSPCDSGQV